jgi:peptide-methionine (R)-S-oxide reductase
MNTTQTIMTVGLVAAGAIALGILAFRYPNRLPGAATIPKREGKPYDGTKVVKSEEEWRAQLTPEQFRITRARGTERSCSGAFWNSKDDGTFLCICCGQPLFDSRTKFDSGTGWPSFREAVDADRVTLKSDDAHGMIRTEVLCSRCDAHLGHVFPDGPPPDGLRYCINSVALKLVPRAEQR